MPTATSPPPGEGDESRPPVIGTGIPIDTPVKPQAIRAAPEQAPADTWRPGKKVAKPEYLVLDTIRAAALQQGRTVHQDMGRPLGDYWISSSHNSYLSGNQLTGESTPAAIEHLLKLGIRVVELDCWPDGKGGIEVNHGHTMCQETTFRGCLQAMADWSFAVSDYPVILTIENHCKGPLEAVMFKDIMDILGPGGANLLYVPPEGAVGKPLPSPAELKHKIMLRDKIKETDPEDKVTEEEAASRAAADAKHGAATAAEDGEAAAPGKLSELISVRNKHFDGFEAAKSSEIVFSCSLSEPKVEKLLEAVGGPDSMRQLAAKHLIRMYPGGTRVDSSNYDPQDAWSSGMQLVALNVQGADEPMWLNQGRFMGNGGCGYVLKPDYIRGTAVGTAAAPLEPKILTVKVVKSSGWTGGWGLEKEPDLYASLAIAGHPKDRTPKQWVTAHKDNTTSPVWDEQTSFSISQPQEAILLLSVWEKDTLSADDLMGQLAFPVVELKQGVHELPLLSHRGITDPKTYGNPTVTIEISLGAATAERAAAVHTGATSNKRGGLFSCCSSRPVEGPRGM